MKTEEIRNKLHQSNDEAEAYSDEFKVELDARYEEYNKDGKTISLEEVNKRVKKILAENK